jgi:hypothetical protein
MRYSNRPLIVEFSSTMFDVPQLFGGEAVKATAKALRHEDPLSIFLRFFAP